MGMGRLSGSRSSIPAFRQRARSGFSFEDAAARCNGVGHALLQAAADFGRSAGAVRLTLSTAHTNLPAQSLYEAAGWLRDEVFRSYHLAL